MPPIDWHAMFVPTVSLLEIVLRGSVVYLSILAVVRIFRREAGTMSTTDLIVIVIIADAAQNAMSADYHSITEGLVLVGTIFAWNYALDWLGFRYRWVYRILNPAPLLLIRRAYFRVHSVTWPPVAVTISPTMSPVGLMSLA
jgi:uncharacterized membrane protein YcaP (DUF421 family)